MAILCGTDLSPRGAEAAEVAAALAVRMKEPLVLAHALTSDPEAAVSGVLGAEALRLEGLFPGLPVEPRLAHGLPDEVLTRLAGAGGDGAVPDVRLVVVASLGRRIPLWLLGSVAERTVQTARVPVLVVRDAAVLRSWLAGARRLRVMVSDDFGAESEAALGWASGMAQVAPCEVIVAHVAPPGPPPGSGRSRKGASARAGDRDVEVRLMAELRSRISPHAWADAPPRAWVVMAEGKRAPLLARLAADERVDLVVLGNRPVPGPSLAWQESVSRGVLYHAAMNVACVPAGTVAVERPSDDASEAAGQDLAARLEAHAFLRGAPGHVLNQLATIAREEKFPAGALILREGGDADRLFLIERGAVALEVTTPGRPPIRLETLGSHDILGLSWLNPPYRWQFDARAVDPVEALVLDAARLREWMQSEPHIGQAVATRLVAQLQQRLERVRLQRLDVYGAEA